MMAEYTKSQAEAIRNLHDPEYKNDLVPLTPEESSQLLSALDRLFAKDELEERQAAERAKSETKQNQPVLAAV
jgi:hypothetical protein